MYQKPKHIHKHINHAPTYALCHSYTYPFTIAQMHSKCICAIWFVSISCFAQKHLLCLPASLCVLFDLRAEAQVVLLRGSQSIDCEAPSVAYAPYVLVRHMQQPRTGTDCASALTWQPSQLVSLSRTST